MAENDWKSRLGVVFSTNPDFKYETEEESPQQQTLPPQKQKLRVFIEKKQRGETGNGHSRIHRDGRGFAGSWPNAQDKMRHRRLSKEGEIIIQGDMCEKTVTILEQSGYNVKRGN